VALIVLDGMSLADWLLIRDGWRPAHGDWEIEERLVLAQVPTLTSVSRQALISGRRPAEFAASLNTNAGEAAAWRCFWTEAGLAADQVSYDRLSLVRNDAIPDAVYKPQMLALCLTDHSVDELSHGASLGAGQVQDSLRLWLVEYGPHLDD
jgi:hypothetical protein